MGICLLKYIWVHLILHVGQWTVQNAFLNYRIAEPQDTPFSPSAEELEVEEPQDILLNLCTTNTLIDVSGAQLLNSTNFRPIGPTVSFTGPLSTPCDNALDALISQLRAHFH